MTTTRREREKMRGHDEEEEEEGTKRWEGWQEHPSFYVNWQREERRKGRETEKETARGRGRGRGRGERSRTSCESRETVGRRVSGEGEWSDLGEEYERVRRGEAGRSTR